MSRSSIIVNISFKPKLEEYKIWILANDDYVLNWLYHVKNDQKLVNLNIVYIKEWDYSKIQIVVFDLLQQKNIFDDYNCVVWMNNLFTSTDVIVTCSDIDFEIVDTIRITKTKRKKQKEIKNIKTQKKRKKVNKNLNSALFDLKLKHEARIEWNIMYEKVTNEINVLQFAWKNQQMIFFITSIDIDQEFVNKMRKKSVKTATNVKTSRVIFDDVATKVLSIFKFIDLYNHYMNEVNVAN